MRLSILDMKEFCFCLSLYLIFFVSCSEKIVFEVFEIQDSTKSLLELPKPKQEARKKSKKSINESIEKKLIKVGEKIKSCLGNTPQINYKNNVRNGKLVLKKLIKKEWLRDYYQIENETIIKYYGNSYKYIIKSEKNKIIRKIKKEDGYLLGKNIISYYLDENTTTLNFKIFNNKVFLKNKINFDDKIVQKEIYIIDSNKNNVLIQALFSSKQLNSENKQNSIIFCFKNRELIELGRIKDYFILKSGEKILNILIELSYDKKSYEYFMDYKNSKLLKLKNKRITTLEYSRAGKKIIILADKGIYQQNMNYNEFDLIKIFESNQMFKMKCVEKYCYIYVVEKAGWPYRITKQKIKVFDLGKRKFIREYKLPKNEFYTNMRIFKDNLILSGKGTMIDNIGNVRIYKMK